MRALSRPSRRMTRVILSLIVLSGLVFLAACAEPDDTPADVSTVATIDDYAGNWTDGSTCNLAITINTVVAGAGDFIFTTSKPSTVSGTLVISNGATSLTARVNWSYDSGQDRLTMGMIPFTRTGVGSGTVVGTWL
jgi:hypothetical protein